MPSYPLYRSTTDGKKTYKLVNSSKRTVLKIDSSENFYEWGGLTTESESSVLSTTVGITATDFDTVLDDLVDCARIGRRPVVHPH